MSSSRPASVFARVAPIPARTVFTVPMVGAVDAVMLPPVRVAPSARTIVLLTAKPFRSSVAPLTRVMVPESEPALPIWTVPLLMVAPAKVLATERSSVPEPFIVRVPVPRFKASVLMVTLPAPPMVRFWSVLLTPPVSVKVPAAEVMLEAVASVIAPPKELSPEILRSAPAEEIPVPLSVSASAPMAMPPCRRSSAPEITDVAPAEVPSAVAWAAVSTPTETVVLPV